MRRQCQAGGSRGRTAGASSRSRSVPSRSLTGRTGRVSSHRWETKRGERRSGAEGGERGRAYGTYVRTARPPHRGAVPLLCPTEPPPNDWPRDVTRCRVVSAWVGISRRGPPLLTGRLAFWAGVRLPSRATCGGKASEGEQSGGGGVWVVSR